MSVETMVYVDATGYHYPDYPTILSWLQEQYRGIYGADVYLEADSQDGQWLAIQAQALYDVAALGAAVYNSFSPATAQSDALSRDVKINGIRRQSPSKSTADLEIVGQTGTTILNGQAEDINGIKWNLPASVTIPAAGEIIETAECATEGAIQAAPNTITKIATPTQGWQTVTNTSAAAAGAPVESDAELRVRQSRSVALPSRTVLEGIEGGVANVAGVTRSQTYENDTDATDSRGLPEHSIAVVVEGGDVDAIAASIVAKKTPGAYTFGSTAVDTVNIYGVPTVIRFSRPTYKTVPVALTIKALTGYNSTVGDAIKQAIADYVNGLPIGGGVSQSVEWADAITAANSVGGGTVYKITAFTLTGGTPDIALAYNEAGQCNPTINITLTVT